MCPVICVNTILWLFFTFQLTILATVPPDWVKLVLKAMSYVTASFCIQFVIPPANCFFVFLLLIKLIKTVHSPQEKNSLLFDLLFNNGDRTQWSPIRSLIIRVIKPGGGLGYFLGGYVPPGTPNWQPVRKKNPLKLIPRSGNGPIFYTPFVKVCKLK